MAQKENTDLEMLLATALKPYRRWIGAYPHVIGIGIGVVEGNLWPLSYVVKVFVDELTTPSSDVSPDKVLPQQIVLEIEGGPAISLPVQVEDIGHVHAQSH